MADTLAPVLLAGPDTVDTPNGRVLTVGEGLKKTDNGPGTTLLIEPSGRLTSLATMGTSGIIAYNDTSKTYIPRQILGGSGINVANGDGKNGNPSITFQPSSVVQLIRVANGAGSVQATVPQINVKAGTGVSVAINSVGSGTAAEIVISTVGIVPGGGTVTSVGATSTDSSLTITGTPNPIVGVGSFNFSVNTIGAPKGGTGQTVYAVGDTLYASGTTALSKLAIGPNRSIMSSTGTAPAWVATTAPTTGQVLGFDGTNIVWTTAASGGVTSVGVTSNDAFVTVSNTPITASGNIALSIGTLSMGKGGTGTSIPVNTNGGILSYSPSDTRVRLLVISPSNPNAVLNADGSGNPRWSGSANTIGQVLIINTLGQLGWSNVPAANGQVFTYVDSTNGAKWVTPAGGSGTVTSVAASSFNSTISISGSPITSAGTIDLSVDVGQTIKQFFSANVAGVVALNAGQTTYTIGTGQIFNTSAVLLSVGQAGGATWNSSDFGIQAKVTSRSPASNFIVTLSQAPVASGTAALSWLILAP